MKKQSWKIYSTAAFLIFLIPFGVFWKSAEVAKNKINVKEFPEEYLYTNPTGVKKAPDPFALKAKDGRYYVYATTGFRVSSSNDLYNWKNEGVVYKKTSKSWGDEFWAPEAVEFNNKYYLYYSAKTANDGRRIGVAVGNSPLGPFEDVYNRPLLDLGYNCLDPHIFTDDDGRKYMYYSRAMSDNIVDSTGRRESHTYVVELNDDMVSLKGEPKFLSKPEQPWENSPGTMKFWNEGPAMIKHKGTYYLMYSANAFTNRKYSVGYSTSKSPMGPFVKYENNPVLSAEEWGNKVSGPGHHSITKSPDGTELWVAYHTHVDPITSGDSRQLNIDRMGFREDGSLYINGPTLTPQLMPSGTTGLRNIAPEAKITASPTQEGYRPGAINDGEIGIYERNEKHEWAAQEGAGAWIQLEWDTNKKINSVFIYDSALKKREIIDGKLIFSNGATIEGIKFPSEPGAAAIVSFDEVEVKWVKFVSDHLVTNGGTTGISEIMVLENSNKN